ncbi:MAG: peptide ABC transporter substrate-binding protein [Negativicutes bacterium]
MNRKLVKILVGILAVAVLLTGCSQSPAQESKATKQKIVTMAMTAPWDTLIPFNTSNGNTDAVLDLLYDKLILLRTDGTVKPRLAKSWKTDDATHTKITFVLDEKAKWHDGTPVTADDVVFTMELMSNPDISVARRSKVAQFAGTKKGVREPGKSFGVKALDKQTVEFTLTEPISLEHMLFIVFRDLYILPRHLLKDIPVKQLMADKFWQKPVGSGPCKFDSMISGERIQFTANKAYHLGAPDFDRFVVRILPESNILSGLINGEIDVVAGSGIGNIPLNDWDMAKKQEKLVTQSVPMLGYQYMSINTKRIPQKVRQAIDMAINRDALVQNLMKGQGIPAPGPLRPDHKYFNKALLPIPYNVEKAKAMIAEAGFDTSKEYELRVSKGNSLRERSAPMLQQDLAKIGIKAKITTTDHPTMLTAARKGDYDFALIGSWGSPDPGESPMNVTPGHLNNFSQNQDPTLGNLGLKGLSAFTPETRRPFYDQYQMVLREQVPFVWLYFANDLVAYNKRISNIHYENFTLHNRSVWEWKVAN